MKFSKMFRIILLLALVKCTTAVIGNRCITNRSRNEIGVCQTWDNCRHLTGWYTRCGIQNGRPIICCPPIDNSTIHVTTSTPTSTPTPTSTTPNIRRQDNERISKKKCREYTMNRESTMNRGMDMCGHSTETLLGAVENATAGEFPHMALMGYERGGLTVWLCTGSLISEDFVLTAAHCTQPTGRDVDLSKVRLGGPNLFSMSMLTHAVDIPVAKIINHPLYTDSLLYNDIALIRLERRVMLSASIRPACLPTGIQEPRGTAIAISVMKNTQLTGYVQKIAVDLLQHNECARFYEGPDISHANSLTAGIRKAEQFCARSVNPEVGVCESVPLQVTSEPDNCSYILIGISSFGVACSETGLPVVYTRTSYYLDWIEDIVWRQ